MCMFGVLWLLGSIPVAACLPRVERPINLDRNREALESGGKYLHGVIGQGDLENPDENWVLVGYWAVLLWALPTDRREKKTFNSLHCCC